MNNKSFFDGKFRQYIGYVLLMTLLVFINSVVHYIADNNLAHGVSSLWSILKVVTTVSIFWLCLPWISFGLCRWQVKHTVIDGKRLCFDGSPTQLFGLWTKWFFLCIITLGIYSFWIFISFQKWKCKHTHFEEAETQKGEGFNGQL